PAGGAVLVVGFDGPREQVAWQCAELARILVPLGGRQTRTLEAEAWSRLAAAPGTALPAPAAVMTFSVVPSLVAETMDRGAGAAGRIMQRIKSQLDPGNILNPGRFIAGI